MLEKDKIALRGASPYNAAITREQFLFYEVRITAKLVCEGLSNDEIVGRIVKENLFQYPTEKSVKKMALACLRRLEALEDSTLVQAIATQPSDVSKQICLYAMMRQYRLVSGREQGGHHRPYSGWDHCVCNGLSGDHRRRADHIAHPG